MYGKDSGDVHIQCPYDKTHLILAKSFSAHLIRCRENHPGHRMAVCRFDRTHRVPKPELSHHHSECRSKYLLDRELQMRAGANNTLAGNIVGPEIVSHHVEETEENWDEVPRFTSNFALFNKQQNRQEEKGPPEPAAPPGANYSASSSSSNKQPFPSQGDEQGIFRRIPLAPSMAAQMSVETRPPQPSSSNEVYQYSVGGTARGSGPGRGRGRGILRSEKPNVGVVRPLTNPQPNTNGQSSTTYDANQMQGPLPGGTGMPNLNFAPDGLHHQTSGFSGQMAGVRGHMLGFPGQTPNFQGQMPVFPTQIPSNPLSYQPPRIPQVDSIHGRTPHMTMSSQFEDRNTNMPVELQMPPQQLESRHKDLLLQRYQQQQHQHLQQLRMQQHLNIQQYQGLLPSSQDREPRMTDPYSQNNGMQGFGPDVYSSSVANSANPTTQASVAPRSLGRGMLNKLRIPASSSRAQAMQAPRDVQSMVPLTELQKDHADSEGDDVERWCDDDVEPIASAPAPQAPGPGSSGPAVVTGLHNANTNGSGNEDDVMDMVSSWLDQQKLNNNEEESDSVLHHKKDFSQLSKDELQKAKRKLEKKLKQITILEQKVTAGAKLSHEEESKLQKKRNIVQDLDKIASLA